MVWREAVDDIAFAMQDLATWLKSQGDRLESVNAPKRPLLGSWGSIWADHKAVRHILPIGDEDRALCGLEPSSVYGWENRNNIYSKDIHVEGACKRCMALFQELGS